MATFGIDTGTKNNILVRLEGNQWSIQPALQALPAGGIPDDSVRWNAPRWTALAEVVASELSERELFPLGVDAALTVARQSDSRWWEEWVGGIYTPSTLEKLSLDVGQAQQRYWMIMARLWTEVTFILTTELGWTIWEGQSVQPEIKVIVEVYPRMSWIGLAAFRGVRVQDSWKRVGSRDAVLGQLNLTCQQDLFNLHARDAAVCAITAQAVLEGRAGFFGEPVEIGGGRSLRGGGIALPR
jgi:hypothetical protein